MPEVLTYFDPPPAGDLPERLASPFAQGAPHPLARRAADELMLKLRRRELPDGIDLDGLAAPGRGKMFGVLVVATPAGRVGWLRGFSGMLDGRWRVDGFAPPLFDSAARDAVWPAGEAELRAFAERHRELVGHGLHAQRRELERVRAQRSNQLLEQIHDTYVIVNARGERRSLRSLHAPELPPGGAGDCAAPKLFGHAYQQGLRPLALAEFWWGAAPLIGDRQAGVFYPACRRKCGAVLPYMLEGLAVDPAPPVADPGDELRVVHEDEWLIVADKPCGILSVPGRHDQGRDSVQVRLEARAGGSGQLSCVQSLDVETSGLWLAAKDRDTFAALQRQFARREIDKRYVAWLDGRVARDQGTVELPLRLDFEDRPRRIHDPLHGKRAVTEWRVLERSPGLTKVALVPRSGRTHQLRVHAAHPLGLGAAIVGDSLYGRDDDRLLLHAEALSFVHPRTGGRVELERRAPF